MSKTETKPAKPKVKVLAEDAHTVTYFPGNPKEPNARITVEKAAFDAEFEREAPRSN